METRRTYRFVLFCLAVALVVVCTDVSAQAGARRRGGIWGDWLVKIQFNEREMESILSFSRDADRNLTGQWISLWGMNELKDVTFENGQLSFTQVFQGRDGQTMTSKFTGTVTEGRLSGTVSSDRGEMKVAGERRPRMPRPGRPAQRMHGPGRGQAGAGEGQGGRGGGATAHDQCPGRGATAAGGRGVPPSPA